MTKRTLHRLSQKQQEQVLLEMRKHLELFGNKTCRYRDGESDQTIADRLGLPFEAVRWRRENHEDFGRLVGPEPGPLVSETARITALEAQMVGLGRQLAELASLVGILRRTVERNPRPGPDLFDSQGMPRQ
jgi:transposase-like protein